MNPSSGRRRPQDDGGDDREGGGGADVARSTSRKSQRTSSNRDSPSAVANNRNGFESAISILRSVLHHKLGLPLTLYLHGGDDNTLYDTLGEWFPELLLDPPIDAADPPDQPAPPPPPPPPLPLPVLQHFARPPSAAFDKIMEQSCREWLNTANGNREEPKERPLTNLYTDALKDELTQQPDHNLTVEHDAEVDLGDGTWGKPDVMVRNASTRHPVLVIEVGTSNDFWWKKVDKCLKYAVGLYDDQGKFTHPVLVTVLTVECETKEKEDAKEEEAEPPKAAEEGVEHGMVYAEDGGQEDDDDEIHQSWSVGAVLIAEEEKEEGKTSKVKEKIEVLEESVNEEEEVDCDEGDEELEDDDDVEDDDKDDEDYEYEVDHDDDEVEKQIYAEFVFATARIGTFLITSRKERSTSLSDFRLALLRRIETSDVNVLSTELGRVVRAACLLSVWTLGRTSIDHDYLGPNCRRVGNKVLRVYDNRLVFTDRRTELFVHAEDPVLVCTLDDPGDDLRNFGERGHGSNTRDTLWDFRGRFSVYATMFYVGKHVAWRPQDFIPVVNHLLWLHQDGFVHGDIRCCNIVFRMDEQGRLIDFDYGGRVVGNPVGAILSYPPGYNFFELADGVRLGTEGGAITMRKDWFAMNAVIFKCHEFRRPRLPPRTGASALGPAQAMLDSDTFLDRKEEFFAFSEQEIPDKIEDIKEHAKALTGFLELAAAAGWTVTPTTELVAALKSWGMDVSNPPGLVGHGENRRPRIMSAPATGSPDKEGRVV